MYLACPSQLSTKHIIRFATPIYFTYFLNVELLVFFQLASIFPDGDLGFVLDCLEQIVLLCEGFLHLGVDLLFFLKESFYVLVHFIININP